MNFLTKHSKAFYYAYGILIAAIILLGVFYASQYADVRVIYSINENGDVFILENTQDSLSNSNYFLFKYFSEGATNGLQAATGFSTNFADYARTVYDFQKLLSKVNDSIIAYGIASLICFALLLVLSNHTRRIYYKSNLIGGVFLPVFVIVFNLILVVKNLNVMGVFNNNSTLFNVVSLLIGDNKAIMSQTGYEGLKANFGCTDLSFILFTVLFIVEIAYSAFMAIYAVLKYKATAEERAEIIKKAVANND